MPEKLAARSGKWDITELMNPYSVPAALTPTDFSSHWSPLSESSLVSAALAVLQGMSDDLRATDLLLCRAGFVGIVDNPER